MSLEPRRASRVPEGVRTSLHFASGCPSTASVMVPRLSEEPCATP